MSKKKGAGYLERTALIRVHTENYEKALIDNRVEQAYHELTQVMRHARVMRGWLHRKLEASS